MREMADGDQQANGKEAPVSSPRKKEMATRIAFFIGLSVMMIILFMYISSIGTEYENWMLLNLLVILGLTTMMGYIWRRNYWKMRRAALEDGYD